MPAALYRGGVGSTRYGTRTGTGAVTEEVRAALLCGSCEQLLERNGESEVLKYVAPKKGKDFPLRERLRVALPRETQGGVDRFAGSDLGLNAQKFGYFALSIVWKATAHDWPMPDGSVLSRANIGEFEPPIRDYLFGNADFPADTAVIVIVCRDDDARRIWTTPIIHVESSCLNFRFLARGILFRVMMGYRLPEYFRNSSCMSPRERIFFGSAAHRMPEILQVFDP